MNKNLLLLGFTILICFYLLEFIFSGSEKYLDISKKREDIFQKEYNKKYEKKTRWYYFKEQKRKNPNIRPIVPPYIYINSDYELFPLSGFSNLETIYCNELGFYSKYKSDKYGFRNENTLWDTKSVDFLMIGDSFGHGACVSTENGIQKNLEKLWNQKKKILNLSYGGNGPLIEYATLKEYANDLEIKNILWFFTEVNDLVDLNLELTDSKLIKYLKNKNYSQNLSLNQAKLNSQHEKMLQKRISDKKKNKITKIFKLSKIRTLIQHNPKIEKSNECTQLPQKEFKEIIDLTQNFATEKNSRLFFIYIPSYDRINNDVNYDKCYKAVIDFINSKNIPLIDLYESFFKKENDPFIYFPFKERGHNNNLGYKKISEKIFNFIENY